MVWVMVTLCAFGLLCAFPKQMLTIVAVVVGGVFLVFYTMQSNRATNLSQLEMSASATASICADPKYPVWVQMTNRTNSRTLNSVSFTLKGYRPGYSNSVVSNYGASSDKIIAPGQTYSACWPLSSYSTLPGGETLQSLQWQVEKNNVNWQ